MSTLHSVVEQTSGYSASYMRIGQVQSSSTIPEAIGEIDSLKTRTSEMSRRILARHHTVVSWFFNSFKADILQSRTCGLEMEDWHLAMAQLSPQDS